MAKNAKHFLLGCAMEENIIERRKFVRYPIYCPIQFKCKDSSPRDASVTINIGEGGALIATRKEIDVNAEFILRFYFNQKEFLIRSRVVHIQYGLESGLYSIGAEFLDRPLDFILNFYDEIEAVMFLQRKIKEERGHEISMAEASIKWYSDALAWQ